MIQTTTKTSTHSNKILLNPTSSKKKKKKKTPLQHGAPAAQPWDVGSAAFDSRFPAWLTRCQMYLPHPWSVIEHGWGLPPRKFGSYVMVTSCKDESGDSSLMRSQSSTNYKWWLAFTGYPIVQLSQTVQQLENWDSRDFNGVFVFFLCVRGVASRAWVASQIVVEGGFQSIPQPDIFYHPQIGVACPPTPMTNNKYLKSTKQHHIHFLVTCTYVPYAAYWPIWCV